MVPKFASCFATPGISTVSTYLRITRAGDHRLVLRRDRDHHLEEGADHAAAQGHPVPAAQRSVPRLTQWHFLIAVC